MAKVEFTRVETDEEVENLDIKDGRFIVTGEGKAFVDYGENRIGIGGTPDTQMSDSSTNSVENRVIKKYVDDIANSIPELSNVYGTSNENGYTQEYINNLETYSTDEIRVGTWLGKPLYRKVIQTTIPTSGNNQNVSFQNNVAIMKSVTGFALQSASGGVNLILPYISITNSWSIYAYYNRANQELIIENSGASFMNNTTCYLIAEYTKTTD